MNTFTEDIFQQAYRKIDRVTDKTGCWPWLGCTGKDGYGKMTHRGKYFAAHQVTWTHANGREPLTRLYQTCELRSCCNPAHWHEWEPTVEIAKPVVCAVPTRAELIAGGLK